MSRPLRIAYPGAWYHVMNRGRRREKVFLDKTDCQAFVDLLQETSDTWNVRIAAYCLMSNHYHLLIMTPEANIVRAMRHINGIFTQRFNRRHSCEGQLFRGRYKSILVGGDSYLLQLVRYIHANPVKAGLAEDAAQYPWSSHNAYLSPAPKWDWLYKSFVLGLFDKDRKAQLKAYRQFMRGDEDGLEEILDRTKWPAVLGAQDFLDWVRGKYYALAKNNEKTQLKELRPGPDKIIQAVCLYYGIDRESLFAVKRGEFNEPRSIAVYLIRKLRRERLIDTGRYFGIESYSTVSSVIERLKSRMGKDQKIKKRLVEIEENMRMSQGQT